MSDTEKEIDLSEESEEDFSASEDEWIPEKNHKNKSSDEDYETDNYNDDEQTPNNVGKRQSNAVRKPAAVLSKLQRDRLYHKYKTTQDTSNPKQNNVALDDSDSSGDDCLVDPAAIDLKSKFFDAVPAPISSQNMPDFDCNIGLKLSDSEDDSDTFEATTSIGISSVSIGKIADFSEHQQFSQQLESAKTHLINFKIKASAGNDSTATTDVGTLLEMGEICKLSKPSKQPAKQKLPAVDSESDWEEVKGNINEKLLLCQRTKILFPSQTKTM